ncbi:MAG: FG-GAP-like repeat-containing protein [Verrucomicrobiota bacterium]
MNSKMMNTVLECNRPRWPFQRRSAAWLPTLTLCLFGILLPARAQDPRLTNTNNPLDRTASMGATVNFVLYAASTNGPMTFQWQHEGTNLPSATNVSLVLVNVTLTNAGRYQATIWNAGGDFTNTRTATLTLDPSFTKITTGPVVVGNESGWACSWADYDDDGDIDLLVGNGPEASGLERMGLFRNDGPAGFVRLTNEVGSLVSQPGRYASGVWADYDNDGALDCLVTDWTDANSRLTLHRNLGNGTFRRETAPPLTQGIPGYVSWVDYDNDGWLDVFDAMAWSDGGVPTNALFHASGSGVFTSVNTGILVKDTFVGVEDAAWGDFDGDGDQDLIVTDPHSWWRNSSAYPNHFYRNEGGGVFTRITTNAIALDRTSSLVPAWADYDNDGRLDVFITSYSDTSRLFHNDGNGQFTKILMGEGAQTGQPAWGDFDNDGDLDLYLARGQGTATNNLFYRNNGNGTFTATTLGSSTSDIASSGSCIWGDYDNDGFLDLFVANNLGGQDCLYHNNGNGNHWLMVKLVGTSSNRSAIGAKVRAYAKVQGRFQWQLRDIQGGNRCQNDPRAHFGLETATNVTTLRIEWPSGTVQELTNVTANQILTVTEPRRPVLALAASPVGFTGVLRADTNLTYQVHAADDLALGWTVLTNITSDATGTAYWSDPAPPPQGRRFYKALKTP